MACACGSNKNGKTQPRSYVVTDATGKRATYRTEVEAVAAAKRTGGSYKAQS